MSDSDAIENIKQRVIVLKKQIEDRKIKIEECKKKNYSKRLIKLKAIQKRALDQICMLVIGVPLDEYIYKCLHDTSYETSLPIDIIKEIWT